MKNLKNWKTKRTEKLGKILGCTISKATSQEIANRLIFENRSDFSEWLVEAITEKLEKKPDKVKSWKKIKNRKTYVGARVSADLFERLKKLAFEKNFTRTDFILSAIDEKLNRN